jgi:hypothetical protein
MAKLLGTAYEVGKTEAVISRRPTSDTALEEGLFIKQGATGYVSLANASAAAAPFGVMAQQENPACAVIISGLKVAVQLDDAITPTAGQIVYASAVTNKATNTSNTSANFATAATFTGVIGTDGRSDNTATKKTTVRWAEINMPNGL